MGEDEEPTVEQPRPMEDTRGYVVRYVGISNVRKLMVSDWKDVGIDHEEVIWLRDPPLNDVPLSRFALTPEEFHRCILADRDFQLVKLGEQ